MITLNLSQIAREFGVSRPTAYIIVRRDDFPPPIPQRLSLTGKRLPPQWEARLVWEWRKAQQA